MQSVSSNAVARTLEWELFTQSQALADFGFQFNSDYSGTFGIDCYSKTSNLLIVSLSFGNVSGQNIGTNGTAIIGTCNIRPKSVAYDYGVTGTGLDYLKTGASVRMGIMRDGRVAILESYGSTNGSNALRATLVVPI